MSSKTIFRDISIEKYTERSVVVRGDTRKYKEDLKILGGKYNSRLKNGPGWIFSKNVETDLKNFINRGVRLVSDQEALAGEERTRIWEKKRQNESDQNTSRLKSHLRNVDDMKQDGIQPTLSEFASVVGLLKKTLEKVTLLEHAVLMLLDDEQKELLNILMKPKTNNTKNTNITKNTKNTKKIIEEDEVYLDSELDEPVRPHKRLL